MAAISNRIQNCGEVFKVQCKNLGNHLLNLIRKINQFIFSKWGFITGASLVTGALFGFYPALPTFAIPAFLLLKKESAKAEKANEKKAAFEGILKESKTHRERKKRPPLEAQGTSSSELNNSTMSTSTSSLRESSSQTLLKKTSPAPIELEGSNSSLVEKPKPVTYSPLSHGDRTPSSFYNQTKQAIDLGYKTTQQGEYSLKSSVLKRTTFSSLSPLKDPATMYSDLDQTIVFQLCPEEMIQKLHSIQLRSSWKTFVWTFGDPREGLELLKNNQSELGQTGELLIQSTLSCFLNEKPLETHLFAQEVQIFRGLKADGYPFTPPFKVDLMLTNQKKIKEKTPESYKELVRDFFRKATLEKALFLYISSSCLMDNLHLYFPLIKEVWDEPEFRGAFIEIYVEARGEGVEEAKKRLTESWESIS